MSPYTFPADDGEIPVGQCDAEIVEAKDGGYSRNGNPQLILEIEDDAGRQLSDWLTMTPRAKWRVQQVWAAAGIPWPESGQVDERDLPGKRIHIEVFDDVFEGVTRRKIKEYSPPVGSDLSPPVAANGAQATFGAAAAAAAPPPADDDEIPF